MEDPEDQSVGEVVSSEEREAPAESPISPATSLEQQQKILHEQSPQKEPEPKRMKTTHRDEEVQQESQSSGSVEKDLEKLNLDGKLRIN